MFCAYTQDRHLRLTNKKCWCHSIGVSSMNGWWLSSFNFPIRASVLRVIDTLVQTKSYYFTRFWGRANFFFVCVWRVTHFLTKLLCKKQHQNCFHNFVKNIWCSDLLYYIFGTKPIFWEETEASNSALSKNFIKVFWSFHQNKESLRLMQR